jgi:tRNA 2-thiouridine synthesizing protein E
MTVTTSQNDALKTEQRTQVPGPWSESLAQHIAAQSGIQLSDAHWEVIRYVRDYYTRQGSVRRSRELSKALDVRFRDKGGNRYLYRLFSGGPVLQACRLGGIPVPENCVDTSFGTAF